MQFESPWLLLGMLAAAIPIIIHLINRRRARIVPFAAMEFILRSNKRLAQRLKLKQLLVLLLRVALIAAIPFALSRPYAVPDIASTLTDAPTSVVFVIDNSVSMGYRTGASTRLDDALSRTRKMVENLGPQSNAGIVRAAEPADALTPELTFDRSRLANAIDEITVSQRVTDLPRALRVAEALLAASSLSHKRIVILSDLQASGWNEVDEPWALASPPQVDIVDLTPAGAELSHASIADVRVHRATEVSPHHIRVEAEVVAHGPRPFDGPVTLKISDRRVENSLHVDAGGRDTTTFLVKLNAATSQAGEVSIPDDALPADNQRAFSVQLTRSIDVLIVNGAPRTIPYRDEVFFLEKALRNSPGELRFQTVVMKAEEVTPQQIEAANAVVLANVLKLSNDAVVALEKFVRAGGGLLFAGGDNVTPSYNEVFSALLPMRVRAVKRAARPSDPEALLKQLTIETVDLDHPVFQVFSNVRDASLFAARFHTYLLLDGKAGQTARVLASYRNGAPFLVEQSLGEGRIAFLTTSVDRDWGDLAIRSSFLPFVQQLVLHVAQRLESRGGQAPLVGETVEIPISPHDERLVIEQPNGRTDVVELKSGSTRRTLRYGHTEQAGLYRIERDRRSEAGTQITYLSVHLDPSESEIERVPLATAQELLATDEQAAGPAPIARMDHRRTNLWPAILFGLFLLLVSESLLVVRA